MYSKYELDPYPLCNSSYKGFYLKNFKSHSYLFDRAYIETRPATGEDYYIPHSRASKCIVVTNIYFDEIGCHKVACFPVKEDLSPCEKNDKPKWIPIGKGFTLSCQPACQYEGAIDTDFRNGNCYLINSLKKILAILPEKLFGMTSKHNFHTGLDIIDGNLKINNLYCESYGLDFNGDDCTSTTGQIIAEILLGQSIYRELFKTKKTNPLLVAKPPIPDYLYVPKNRKKRSVEYSSPNMDTKLLHDIAVELSVDFGVDLTLDSIQHILKKRVPGLVIKASSNIPIKSAMIQAVLKSQTTAVINISKMAARGISTASTAFSLYGIVSMIFDIFDPFEYNRVLDKSTLDAVNRQLDLKFYKREFYKPIKVTPDFVWENVLLEEDQTESYTFMAERIKEYLNEIHQAPPDKKLFKLKKETLNYETKNNLFDKHIESLTETQKEFITLIKDWFAHQRNMLILVTGGPGSGKTYTVIETFKHLNIATIKMAPTARIACKIDGRTIHSTMRLDWREGSQLKQIERELQEENNVQTCLEKILFIAMGDKRQLKPVMSQYNIFHVSFDKEFETYFIEFKESKRFLPEYLKIIEQLRELVDKREEEKLLEFISTEFPVVESIDTNMLKKCKKALVYKNATADVYNAYYTSQFPGKAYRLYKIENGKVCKNSFVDLKPGCEVAVTENFATKWDLQNVVTNGTVLVFEKYVAKYDTCKCIDMNGQDVYIKRNEYSGMIPLVPNFARTIHKYQGETIDTDGIVFNFDGCTDLNLIYTALSRVCSMTQIIAIAL
ncbi:uncharacterized protein TNIN_276531 [Trichonephila inaurata madagascariensis]|uniref:Baculoviridae p74 N-terminal domain-containing protein n=1 Tax=Trichonephila inaurata madagascariensis TaxID=2747483 RepID=A0A8X7BQL5_9ARAC|nr:uncharacterized protein TNIN_276531 [Trichonephila inaurata madagascariensis]